MKATSNLSPVGKFIRDALKLKQRTEGPFWSQNELARRSDISSGGLSQIMTGRVEPTAPVLQRIAQALGISEEEIYRVAGLLGNEEEGLPSALLFAAREIADLGDPALRAAATQIVQSVAVAFRQLDYPATAEDAEVEALLELGGREMTADALRAWLTEKPERARRLLALWGQVASDEERQQLVRRFASPANHAQ